jgi:hypothetical protein
LEVRTLVFPHFVGTYLLRGSFNKYIESYGNCFVLCVLAEAVMAAAFVRCVYARFTAITYTAG